MAFHVRTARGVVHRMTEGRVYTHHGYDRVNRLECPAGKADCGSITSMAGVVTTEPVNCPRCLKAR